MTRLAIAADGLPHDLQPGSFTSIELLAPAPNLPDVPLSRLRQACDQASAAGCEWLFAPEAGETLRSDALAIAAPALGYDAIFGAVEVAGSGEGVWRPSRLAFEDPARLPHALLHWWVGTTHLVRVDVARGVLDGLDEKASRLDYLFALWAGHRCIKLAQPLLSVDTVPAPISAEEKQVVLAQLADHPVLLPVSFGRDSYHLPYTGRNAGIERDQTRGDFFEAAELHYLLRRIGTGQRIVDVGANTGNHTVFFAGPMQAASVIPFEPLPDVAAILRRSVGANGLDNVDLSQLGVGLSDAPGRAGVVRSERGGLGASRLVDDPNGEIPVMRLDDALTEAVDFLKIDVESMEMQVLAGAAGIISRDRPIIFIEIANENTTAFVEWLTQGNYRVERIFSDKGHSNYLIAPGGD
jgi:FkbM family methyltransferase